MCRAAPAFLLATAAVAAGGQARGGALEVYASLARTAGSGFGAPRLSIVDRPPAGRRIAWFDPQGPEIGVETRALAVCRTLGPISNDCVAFLLGHELAHFYREHNWGADFGARFAGTPLGETVHRQTLSAERTMEMESQADETGGMYSHMAGFHALETAPAILAALYGAFHLPPALDGYPSLAERQRIAKRAARSLDDLTAVFEAGNLLLLRHHPEEAALCFEYVGHRFPSREIWNGAGVALALAAAETLPDAAAYPWILDGETRLAPRRGRSGEDRSRFLLEAAREKFYHALAVDPRYGPAHINLAGVSALLGRAGTAVDEAREGFALSAQSPRMQEVAVIAEAFALFRAGNSAASIGRLKEGSGKLVEEWSSAMASNRLPAPRLRANLDARDEDELPLCGRLASELNLRNGGGVVIGPRLRLESRRDRRTLQLRLRGASIDIRAIVAFPSGAATARGIRTGASWNEVSKTFGDPDLEYAASAGRLAVFENARLIVGTDGRDSVNRIAVYYESASFVRN